MTLNNVRINLPLKVNLKVLIDIVTLYHSFYRLLVDFNSRKKLNALLKICNV